MSNRMTDPNEMMMCSRMLDENISDLKKILERSHIAISRMRQNHIPYHK